MRLDRLDCKICKWEHYNRKILVYILLCRYLSYFVGYLSFFVVSYMSFSGHGCVHGADCTRDGADVVLRVGTLRSDSLGSAGPLLRPQQRWVRTAC